MRTRIIQYEARAIGATFIVLVLQVFGLVGIFYLRPVENDPYMNSVDVSEINDDHLVLADGRVVRVYGSVNERSRKAIHDSASRVDIEVDETNLVAVYGKQQIFRCGLGMPMIVLPIIPINAPKYNRTLLEIGEFQGLPRPNRTQPCPELEQFGRE